jgi:hypothetical protein
MFKYKGVKIELFIFGYAFGVFVNNADDSPLFNTKQEALEYAKNLVDQMAVA